MPRLAQPDSPAAEVRRDLGRLTADPRVLGLVDALLDTLEEQYEEVSRLRRAICALVDRADPTRA